MTAAPKPSTRKSKLTYALFALLGLALLGFIGGKIAIDAYLRSNRFRTFLAHKAGETMRSEVEIEPVQFNGSSIYSDAFRARGALDAAFSALDLDRVRIDVSARRFFQHVWDIDHVDIERVRLALDGPRLPAAASSDPSKPLPPEADHGSTLLPNRVEVHAGSVKEADVSWAGGSVTGIAVSATENEGGWNVTGKSGRLRQARMPEMDVSSLKLRYKDRTIFVQEAELRDGVNGALNLTGDIALDERADLRAKLSNISMTPLLANDWRAKIHGNLSGDVHIVSAIPADDRADISGSLHVLDGHIEALPLLDRIAGLTDTAQFRSLSLSTASGDFKWTSARLTINNLVLESAGLIRIEGSLAIDNGRLDGSFQVGVTAPSLQRLPGTHDHVFTVSRGGYLWAPMRLTGTTEHPKEDLSPRIAAAMGAAGLDAVAELLNGNIGTARDAAGAAQGTVNKLIDTAGKVLGNLLGP